MITNKKLPPKVGMLIGVRLQSEPLSKLDEWRRQQDDLPGRPEAIRRLVEAGLAAKRSRSK